MSLVGESWRGERPLATVFWGYYVAFYIVFLIALGVLGSALPAPFSTIIVLAAVLFLLPYNIWILVSIWRCATNSKPVWRALARIWIIMALIGGIGRMAATGIERYQYYSEKAQQLETERR